MSSSTISSNTVSSSDVTSSNVNSSVITLIKSPLNYSELQKILKNYADQDHITQDVADLLFDDFSKFIWFYKERAEAVKELHDSLKNMADQDHMTEDVAEMIFEEISTVM
jgi:hypothetical protein